MKKIVFLLLLIIASSMYFNKKRLVPKQTEQLHKKEELIALPVKHFIKNKEESSGEIKAVEHRSEIKEQVHLIQTPADYAENPQSIEQFKRENPEANVRVEKFDSVVMPTLEEFKKDNPDVNVEIETFEMSPEKK